MEGSDKSAAHRHVPRLVLSHHIQAKVHGTGAVGQFNNWLAVNITKSVGTMWAAYLFTLISVGGAVAVITNNVFWTAVSVLISQTFLQLVLLPIIIVGQNVIQAANDERAIADHETLTAVHQLTVEVHAINEAQTAILKELRAATPG